MSATGSSLTINLGSPAMQGFIGSSQQRVEKIPFASETLRQRHELQKRAQGWEASYNWVGSDGNRDLYEITLKRMDFQ